MAQTPTKENDSDVASGNVRINACVCSMDVNMSSQANLRLPFLQNCFHISLLSVGSSCVSQTVGQQGVGTCMRHTSRHTSLYFYLCEDFYRHNASISHHFPKMLVDWVLMLLSVLASTIIHTPTHACTHPHTHRLKNKAIISLFSAQWISLQGWVGGVTTSIDKVNSGMRGHMRSGVTEFNCSEPVVVSYVWHVQMTNTMLAGVKHHRKHCWEMENTQQAAGPEFQQQESSGGNLVNTPL